MSDISFVQRLAGLSRLVSILIVVALVAAVILVFSQRSSDKTLTVDFPQTNSVYEGSDVRILGVAVGTIDSLTPQGDVVRVEISYDGDIQLPQDVKAVVVSPAIVGDRFVQLSPAFDGGPALDDGAHLSVENTAVPVELDEVYQSVNDLSLALGPDGANSDGALSSLISDTAEQLDGQGAQFNETIRNFSQLSTTLSNNADDLFGSVREISEFVAMLERNDRVVRQFNDTTAAVAEVLEDEREDLAATLAALSTALIDVEELIADNRGALRTNVENLRVVAETLAARQTEFGEISVAAPTALSNVALAYNGVYGTLDTRANLIESIIGPVTNPENLFCQLLGEPGGPGERCTELGELLGGLLGPLGLTDLLRAPVANQPLESERVASSVAEMLAVGP